MGELKDYGATHADPADKLLVDGGEAEAANGGGDRHPDKVDNEEDYDPHVHRKLDRPTNNLESLVHLLKCSLGTGILAMPQAFSRVGLVAGIVGTVLGGVLVTHCLHVLVKAQYLQCKRLRVPLLPYPDAMSAALTNGPEKLRNLARPSAVAVDVFLVLYQLGICCVYIVFIADNIKKLVDPYYEMSVTYHMLIVLAPLMGFNLIPDLKILAPFSALANVLTFVGLGAVGYLIIATPALTEAPMEMMGAAAEIPLFFGTVLFALTAVGVVVAIENNMKTPKEFGSPFGVLNVGMGIIVVMYVTMGAIGYNFCRDKCGDSITLDMPQGQWIAQASVAMFAIAIFISYGLQCYVPVQIIWSAVEVKLSPDSSERKRTLAQYGVRMALCLLTFVAAVSVPRLGLFISLFGALCLSALGLVFPAAMEALGTASLGTRVKDVVIALLGLLAMVTGTYSALDAIVRSFQPK